MEDNKTLIEALLAKAKALDEKATPGPWKWDMRTRLHSCKLITDHSGQYYVMDFERWGMQDACPEFQVYEHYTGPVTKRGSKGMERADKMARSYPGKEHHRGYDEYIDHPDAVFIAESRSMVTELIKAVTALQTENAEKDKEIERLKNIVEAYSTAGRSIALCLKSYCDRSLPYAEMIMEAARKAGEALSRVEAERDAAVEENEFRKHVVLTPLYTCGGHGYDYDDDEDFWCPVCRQHLGTHRGFETTCPRCGQEINSDGEPCWDYDELRRMEYDRLPKSWERGAQGVE